LICSALRRSPPSARALHVLPGSASVYSSAVKFAVSKLLLDAMDRLADLLGAHFYLREGPVALYQKLLRDLAPVGFGHIARAACQMSLLPQLPTLAKRTSISASVVSLASTNSWCSCPVSAERRARSADRRSPQNLPGLHARGQARKAG
jgi:hypothetical protein